MMTSLVAWESTLYMQVEVSSPPTQRIYGGPLLVEQSIIHILTFLRYWSKPIQRAYFVSRICGQIPSVC